MYPHSPTPVTRLRTLESGPGTLWVKDDGQLGTRYGGNKVRKLALLLAGTRERGIRRILTLGAAGSHHVLATTLCGAESGLEVNALLVSQPHTLHAENTLRCSFGYGARILRLGAWSELWTALRLLRQRDVMWLGPGAMGVVGSTSYAHAVTELQAQIDEGALPEPDQIVVALGSGSTAAGLLVGLERTRSRCQLVAVAAAPSPWSRASVLAQAWRVARRLQVDTSLRRLAERLHVDSSEAGDGYGVPTPAGTRALEAAQGVGLTLDPTYTAKAFAGALRRTAHSQGATLYWHTLSSHALAPLLQRAPNSAPLPDALRALLR